MSRAFRLKPYLLVGALVALAAPLSHAALVATQVPVGMRKQNMEITVAWAGGNGRVHLRASTAPGGASAISHYDSLHLPSQSDAGSYSFKINPDIPVAYRNTDLRLGVNFCILTDGVQRSAEFLVLVESSVAPSLVSPANAAEIKDLTPTFSWTGDAPYYAVLVSDEPFKITEEGTVTGVSAIWQIITPFTSARYGDADPSGLNAVAAPPLISGKTYNWLVLNNYGNNAGATSKVAPVPASFVYLPAPPLPQSTLIEPKDKDTLPAPDAIDFRWSLVDGAVSYKLEVLEENLVDGSQADVVLWKASSTGGQVRLENATGVLRRYNYKWRVYAVGNNGSASLSAKRSFFYSITVGDMSVLLRDDQGRKIAYAAVKVNRLGGASSAVFQNGSTDADGLLSIKNAALGTYVAEALNVDGYQAEADTFSHASASGTTHTMILKPVQGKIVGKVSTANGTGLLNARVTATASDGAEWTGLTNSQGSYSLGVSLGNWLVKASAAGYQASSATTVSPNGSTPARSADFTLSPYPFTLSGTVQNSFTKQGIFGARVSLTQVAETRQANTDGNGAWSFPVPAGSFTLRVSSAGFAAPEPMALSVTGDRSVNLALDPNASILSGRAKDGAGTALSGALIQATPKAGPARSVACDAQGYFELSLSAGDWTLTASAKGYSPRASHRFLLDVSKTVQGADFALDANRSFVAGRVTESGTGLPGVKVSSGEASALTDNSGYYLLSLAVGTHRLQAQKVGYLVPRTHDVPLNPGDTASGFDFQATGNAGVIRGRALSGGSGMAGTRIEAAHKSTRETFAATTDGDGAYALSLPGGEYTVSAAKEGFALDKALEIPLAPGGTFLDADLRLALDQGTLQGTVASGNAGLNGCEVSYRHPTHSALAGKTVTDPQGRYSLGLQAGAAYAITASCALYQASAASSGNLARGASLTLDFNLAKAGSSLKGRAVDGRGALSGVKVTAERNGEAVATTSDYAGAWQLSLASAAYTLSFSKVGYRTQSVQTALQPGENARAADTLVSSLGRISGRITAEGSGLSGALATLVGLTPEAGGGVFSTDAEGRFASENLPAGGYSLTASADGHADGKIASLTILADQLATAELALVPNRSTLSGTVEITGAAPTAVRVVANAFGLSRSVAPAADGKWSLERLPAGVYAVSAGLAGYSADSARNAVTVGASATVGGIRFALTKNAGSLAGTVSGADAAAGIRVNLAGLKGGRAYGVCDAAGRYSIPSLAEDTYTLTVTAPGYKLDGADQQSRFAIGEALTRNLALVPAIIRVAGKVSNQVGAALGGLPVELRHPTGTPRTLTAADGSFAFSGVPAGGEYQVSFKPPTAEYDAKDTLFTRTLSDTGTTRVDITTLSRSSSLSGTVQLDGSPVEGAQLKLTGTFNNLLALSQPGGAFRIYGVAGSERTLALSVSRPGAGTVDTSLVVGPTEARAGFAIRLRTLKLTLTGTLRDSEGKALAGAKAVLSGGTRPDTLTASASGVITMADLSANQTLSLATLLNKDRYDNVEIPLRLREKDTAVQVAVTVHGSTLGVQVKDQDGAAVNGAEVILNGKALGLTASGAAQARFLPRGEYRIAAGKSGYRSGPESRLNLSGDTAATVSLTLAQVTGGLYGTVRDTGFDAAGGAAKKLAGAVVRLVSGSDTLVDTADALGQYAVAGLVDGSDYVASVILPGYAALRVSVTGSGQAQNRDLILRPFAGSVAGRIASGRPGVMVRLYQAATGRIRTSATVSGGYYGFLALEDRSEYRVQAVDGVEASPALAVQGAGGKALRADLVLEALGRIEGGATAGTLGALPGARVEARLVLTGASSWTLTDSSGVYALPGLAAGEYEVAVGRLGFRSPASRRVSVTRGMASTGIVFSLEAGDAGFAGVVADQAGRPLIARVWLVRGADTLASSAGGGGQILFTGIPAGDHALTAAEPGFSQGTSTVRYSGTGMVLGALAVQRDGNRILGMVRDAMTNTSISGGTVRISGTGTQAITDSTGRYLLSLPAETGNPVLLQVSKDGYIAREGQPVWRDADGTALADLALTPDYRQDGEITVTVREGGAQLDGLILSLVPFHPDDQALAGLSGPVPFAFRNLRRPAPYTLKVRREGFKDLTKVVELGAGSASVPVVVSYPTSQIRLFVTSDGRRGKGVDVTLGGQRLAEHPDTAGLYISAAKLKPGRYEASVLDLDTGLVPLSPHYITLGEDSVRTDTLVAGFRKLPIRDSIIDTAFTVSIARTDSAKPAPGVVARLYYRLDGASLWDSLALDSIAGGFSGTLPPQKRAGTYEYFHRIVSPSGVRIGVTGAATSRGTAQAVHSNAQSPSRFRLRDPLLLQSIALAPQRLEADTSLYSLSARDLWQVQMRGENGRVLDAHFNRRAVAGDTAFAVDWSFADPGKAVAMGLTLTLDPEAPRYCLFRGGRVPADEAIAVLCVVRMGAVRLRKTLLVKIQDLTPESIGIRFVKENRILAAGDAALLLPNSNPAGFAFAAFARTAEGRTYNIAPRWSLGSDSAAGTLTQQGHFTPDPSVARSAVLRIVDTLSIGGAGSGRVAFAFEAELATYAQVVPAASGTSVVRNGEGAELEFNLAGLTKAFTVSVKKPKVSGLLRASPKEEVVGEILDIELSESQPFKADSGAMLKLPVEPGIARRSMVFLGHWNTSRLTWEKVAEVKGDSVVRGLVYGFSKYAVLMGSLPLGAYDLVAKPNPFSANDPWGLQLGYKVSSDVSSQVGVRIEVYNMMGDKVYESHERQLSKGESIEPGSRKADPKGSGRRTDLGPLVWDGRTTAGVLCRNGRYLLKLIVKDGKGSKEYLKKVVMLK